MHDGRLGVPETPEIAPKPSERPPLEHETTASMVRPRTCVQRRTPLAIVCIGELADGLAQQGGGGKQEQTPKQPRRKWTIRRQPPRRSSMSSAAQLTADVDRSATVATCKRRAIRGRFFATNRALGRVLKPVSERERRFYEEATQLAEWRARAAGVLWRDARRTPSSRC
jgi:hypothetical protein